MHIAIIIVCFCIFVASEALSKDKDDTEESPWWVEEVETAKTQRSSK